MIKTMKMVMSLLTGHVQFGYAEVQQRGDRFISDVARFVILIIITVSFIITTTMAMSTHEVLGGRLGLLLLERMLQLRRRLHDTITSIAFNVSTIISLLSIVSRSNMIFQWASIASGPLFAVSTSSFLASSDVAPPVLSLICYHQ
jgi:hypothetical protein